MNHLFDTHTFQRSRYNTCNRYDHKVILQKATSDQHSLPTDIRIAPDLITFKQNKKQDVQRTFITQYQLQSGCKMNTYSKQLHYKLNMQM